MKRTRVTIIGLLAAVALLAAACGNDTKDSSSGSSGTSSSGVVKAAWIYVGPINDGGWTQSHDAGRKYVEQKLGSALSADVEGYVKWLSDLVVNTPNGEDPLLVNEGEGRIFGLEPAAVDVEVVLRAQRAAVGGTIAAALAVSTGELRVGVNLGGGFHHATADRGGGFCVYNDVAVAWRAPNGVAQLGRANIVALWEVVDPQPIDNEVAPGTIWTVTNPGTINVANGVSTQNIPTQVPGSANVTGTFETVLVDFMNRLGDADELLMLQRLNAAHPGCA